MIGPRGTEASGRTLLQKQKLKATQALKCAANWTTNNPYSGSGTRNGIFGLRDTQRLEAGTGFRNKSLKPAKLANVQPVGRPIFNIQYPMFGIEYVALDAQRLEAANWIQKQSLEPGQARICATTLASNIQYSVSDVRNGIFGLRITER